VSDSATGLPDTLVSDDDVRDTEHDQLLTEGVDSDQNETVDVDDPPVTGICIYVFRHFYASTNIWQCRRQRYIFCRVCASL